MKRMLILVLVLLLGWMLWFYAPWDGSLVEDDGPRFEPGNARHGLAYDSTDRAEPGPLAPGFVDNNGVFAADVNRDRWTDVLLTGGTTPVLLMNRAGQLERVETFPEVHFKVSTAAFVDLNVDGWKDLVLVPQEGKPRVLRNESGHYRDIRSLQVPHLNSGAGISVGDVNRDGCPDVFLLQYSTGAKEPNAPNRHKLYRLGTPKDERPRSDSGEPNFLLLGDCKGGVRQKSSAVFDRKHFSLASSMADFTGNGWLDIHVANDFYWDSLYVNDGEGQFRHRYLPDSTDRNGMSSTVTDLNNDRLPDLFVSNIYVPENSSIIDRQNFKFLATSTPAGHNLLVNQGNGQFLERAGEAGLNRPGWGWDAVFADFTNDGRAELFQCRQNYLRAERKMRLFELGTPGLPPLLKELTRSERSVSDTTRRHRLYGELKYWLGFPALFTRTGGGLRYRSRLLSDDRRDCRGVVAEDFDRDGHQDVLLSAYRDPFELLVNTSRPEADSVVRVHFDDPRFYQGGWIVLETARAERRIPITARTGYKSQQPPIYHRGVRSDRSLQAVKIRYNGGPTLRKKVSELPAELVVEPDGIRVIE